MNEPQIWTLIGVLATGMIAMLTLISTLFLRVIRAEFGSVRAEFGSVRAEIGSVRAEIGSVRAEFGSVRGEIAGLRREMSSEFEAVRREMSGEFAAVRTEIHSVRGRIDHLDRDVSAIYRHLFGIDRG